jgi:hypothetical protein
MKKDDHVAITLMCLGCRREQIMRIPRERGIKPGKYSWECIVGQEKRYGVLDSGWQGDHKAEQAGRGGNGRPTEGRGGK